MKKYITYTTILLAGLFIGWLVFSGSNKSDKNHEQELSQTENGMWTCSMHPQIMQPEPGDCPICGMDLIPAETTTEGLAPDQFKLTETAIALANVETIVVGQNNKADINSITLSGKIASNDKASAIQAAHFGGRLEKLYFKSEGEFVKNGALIASIYSPELVTAQNELIEAIDLKESQPELYNAVRNKLKYWKISEKQIQNIEQNKKVISNFNMYSDTFGYIEEIFIEEGNHVKEGEGLFKVVNLTSVWANFDVYEQDIKALKLGQEISLTLNAYPEENIKAKVDYIDPILNETTRTVSIRATLTNKDNRLKPGMLISGELLLTSKATQSSNISIPKSSVLWTGKRSVVYVKTSASEPIFEMREVTLGDVSGPNYMVLSGLEFGEEIVTNGTFTIDAAAQLQGKKSMMNKEGGKTMTGHENHSKSQSGLNKIDSIERFEVPVEFQNQLNAIAKIYSIIKDNLAADNSDDSKKNANTLLNNLENVNMKLLADDDAHKKWMSFEKEIKISANAIASTLEIEIQRNNFITLSNSIINSIAHFGINQKVYAQFCPMANNNKGASWLSIEKEVTNPYYGAAMLKCGSVKHVIE